MSISLKSIAKKFLKTSFKAGGIPANKDADFCMADMKVAITASFCARDFDSILFS